MNKTIYDIWFSRVEINNKIKLKLLENNSSELIYNMNKNDLENQGLQERIIEKILNDEYRENLIKYEEYMNKRNIRIINFKDRNYPTKLYNIADKPAYIYVRGNLEILYEDSVAIVGSRNATEYGKYVSRKLAKEIADKNVNIISGLAIGIDKYAHLGALDSKIGKTIAVLGNGLGDNDIYPYENKKVFEKILENNGAIVSEYIIGTKPEKYHFPARNRIISGLSDKVIVVEAKEKSGSIITVDFALEQGKDVFAVPGNITSLNSIGTNRLIKEGASCLNSSKDIFEQ